jgi:hypothetical protein
MIIRDSCEQLVGDKVGFVAPHSLWIVETFRDNPIGQLPNRDDAPANLRQDCLWLTPEVSTMA